MERGWRAVKTRGAFRTLVVTAVILAVLFVSAPGAGAKTIAFVSVDKAGILYEYFYEELLHSYVLSLLGATAPLFSDFNKKDMTLFLDDINGYVDYEATLAAYVRAIIAGQPFDLDKYTSGPDAVVTTVAKVLVVTEENGRLVFTDKELANPEEAALQEINAARDAHALCRIIETRYRSLGLDLQAYNKLMAGGKIAVAEGILLARGKGFTDGTSFRVCFEQEVEKVRFSVEELLNSLNSAETVAEFSAVLLEAAGIFELEMEAYKLIISTRIEGVIASVFQQTPFSNPAAVGTCFNDAVAAVLKSYVLVTNTPYNYSVSDMVNTQMPLRPQWYVAGVGWTDAPRAQVQYYVDPANFVLAELARSVEELVVATDVLLVRDAPTTNAASVGSIKRGEIYSVEAVEKVTSGTAAGSEGYWFKIRVKDASGWVCGNYANWVAGDYSPEMFQFLLLSGKSGATLSDLALILTGKGILGGTEAVFLQASRSNNINEIFLTSLALHETGNGTSQLAKGLLFTPTDPALPPRVVYNMFGIGAVDSNPLLKGAEYAYNQGWFSPEEAIIGGAYFVARNYVGNSNYYQDTLYKMRWNPGAPGRHQYATDIGWASKQTSFIRQLYGLVKMYNLRFDIPAYKETE